MAAAEQMDNPSWLVMQAQNEQATGKPGIATAQLGQMALKNGFPKDAAAFHAQKAGVMPSPANPAGAAGSTMGDPSAINNSPALAQLAKLKSASKNMGMPETQAEAQEIPKGTSEQVKEDNTNKAQTTTSQKIPYSPETQKLNMDINRGISHPITGYEPLLGVLGKPALGADGKPIPDKTKPIYDLSTESTDPTHPYQEQKSSLDKLQELVKARSAQGIPTRPTDLSGLMMAADFLNHTNAFSSGYKGQQANQNAARAEADKVGEQNLQNEIGVQKSRNDLQKDLISSSNATLNGGTQAQMMQNMENLALQQGFNNQPKGSATTPINQVMGHVEKNFKDVMADEAEADKVTSLVNSHNPAAISGIKEALTRLMTGARPQMALIQQQAQDPSLGQRLESYMSLATSGQLPIENVAQMNQMVSDLNKVSDGRRAVATHQMISFGQQMGRTPEEMMQLIPNRANSQFPSMATAQGHKSVAVAQGKAASRGYDADVVAYAKKHDISESQAAEIKKQRTGGQ